MKTQTLGRLLVITLLTGAQPILAADGEIRESLKGSQVERLRDYGLNVNPQAGVSSFEHSGRSGSVHSGALGVTAELGQTSIRMLETGLLVVQMGSDAARTTFLTVPMMAKIRLFSRPAQSWYAKAGVSTAFELSSTDKAATNNVDLLAALGVGGRFAFNSRSDLIIESTYNRGLLASVRGSESAYNQGVLVMAGLSFKL